MVRGGIVFIPLAEHDDDFEGEGAILQCGLKGISPASERNTIAVLKVDGFEFMMIELLDESNDLVDP